MKPARLTGSPRLIWIAFIFIAFIWMTYIFIAFIQESSVIVLGLVRLVLLYQAILNCSNEAFSHPSILARLSPQTQVQLQLQLACLEDVPPQLGLPHRVRAAAGLLPPGAALPPAGGGGLQALGLGGSGRLALEGTRLPGAASTGGRWQTGVGQWLCIV